MLTGAVTIGQALSQLDSFNIAMTSAGEIFPIIDRVSLSFRISYRLL